VTRSRPVRARAAVSAALFAAAALAACGGSGGAGGGGPSGPVAPAEVRVGERLFHETRFAQSFAARVAGRSLSDPAPGHDPAVDVLETPTGPVASPFAGRSMACAACHLSDEAEGTGVRAFCDFAAHTPIPDRGDGRTHTSRSTPAIRDAGLAPTGTFFHADGEFVSLEDLCAATLAGRNFGWLANEHDAAFAHAARVVREDAGSAGDAVEPGGAPYAAVLTGTAGVAPDGALLPAPWRVDAASASDAEVVAAVARLIARYVVSLSQTPDGTAPRAFGSAYDVFLRKNGLPEAPLPGEGDLAYARRLRAALKALSTPLDVGAADGRLLTHDHPFLFGAQERRGLTVFLTEPPPPGFPPPPPPPPGTSAGVGSCVTCHAPPRFSDFRFHGVGASQAEYDAVHGPGAFLLLPVPDLATRSADPDTFLPPSAAHPAAEGRFASAPDALAPERADLGLWNVYANPAVPAPQAGLRAFALARLGLPPFTPDALVLPATLGWMKTPTLRDLGHSAPYFHGGHAPTLEEAVQHYRATALSARFGLVRNVAPELLGIDFEVDDLLALAAFLRSLDEDP
jgi:cytochrome c peroxidase